MCRLELSFAQGTPFLTSQHVLLHSQPHHAVHNLRLHKSISQRCNVYSIILVILVRTESISSFVPRMEQFYGTRALLLLWGSQLVSHHLETILHTMQFFFWQINAASVPIFYRKRSASETAPCEVGWSKSDDNYGGLRFQSCRSNIRGYIFHGSGHATTTCLNSSVDTIRDSTAGLSVVNNKAARTACSHAPSWGFRQVDFSRDPVFLGGVRPVPH